MAALPVAQAREDVAALFLSYLGRAPEFEAMNYYVGLYNQLLADQGTNPAAVSNAFKALSAQIYVDAGNIGEIPAGPSVTDGEYVDWIYQNVLGRAADEAGRAYWLEQLADGTIDRAELVGIVIAAAGDDVRDAAYLANRTEVALEFAKFENSNPQILGSLTFNAKQVLEGVNEDPATVAAAEAKLYSATNGGESFTLTPGVDNLVGTGGDDVFNAVPVNPTNSNPATTLNAFDTIDGGTGRDTLNIYTDGAHNTVQQGTIRNVEVINIYNADSGALFGGKTDSVDASKFSGVEELWQHNRANAVTNLATTTVAGFANVSADEFFVGAAGATATVALQGVSGEDQSYLAVVASGASLNTIVLRGELVDGNTEDDVDAAVFLAIENTGKADVGTVTLDSTLDVRGINLEGKNITGLDASASTGDIWYDVDAKVTTVIGGSGDDVFVFGADRALTLTDNIDGGEGVNTVVTAQDGVFATQDYDALDRLTNIDALAFIGTNVQVNAAELTAFETLAFGGNGLVAIENLAADQGVVLFDNREFGDGNSSPLYVVLGNSAADVAITLDSGGEFLSSIPKLLITDESAFDFGGVGGFPFPPVFPGDDGDGDDDDDDDDGEDVDNPFDELFGGKGLEQGATGGTLTLDGAGTLVYGNGGGKFDTIDVSELDGFFLLYSMSAEVEETVTLGENVISLIVVDVVGGSSTLGLTDVIEGFTAIDFSAFVGGDDDDDAEFEAPDAGTILFGLGAIEQIEIAAGGSRDLALAAAAQTYVDEGLDGTDVVLFHWQGDTYLYANTSDTGKYDDSDFLIQIVGTFSEEAFAYPFDNSPG